MNRLSSPTLSLFSLHAIWHFSFPSLNSSCPSKRASDFLLERALVIKLEKGGRGNRLYKNIHDEFFGLSGKNCYRSGRKKKAYKVESFLLKNINIAFKIWDLTEIHSKNSIHWESKFSKINFCQIIGIEKQTAENILTYFHMILNVVTIRI